MPLSLSFLGELLLCWSGIVLYLPVAFIISLYYGSVSDGFGRVGCGDERILWLCGVLLLWACRIS